MAIRRMVTKERWLESPETVEVVTNYHGHEDGRVQHDSKCPHAGKHDLSGARSPECFDKWEDGHGTCSVFGPLYMETTHVGVVLALGEYNGYDDSDFYAVVWNADKGATERVGYASTRGWTYPNGAAVDATPEVVAEYEAFCAAARKRAAAEKAAEEAATPRKGRTVKVVRGRKVPVGTVGTVIWYGAGKSFGPAPRYRGGWSTTAPMRVGIKDAAGTVHWTAASNVEVVEPADKEAA